MAFITKDQKAKTVVQILYERFISIFGAPTKLLSDRGTNFTSALVEELFSVFGIQNAGLQPITHNVMDKSRDFIKLYLE